MSKTEPRTESAPTDMGRASAAPEEAATMQAQQQPAETVSKRAVVAVLITTFGNTAATLMPAIVTLPIVVARIAPHNKETGLGIALGILAFVGMLFSPLFGAISDRTTSRLGMRKPGMIVGPAVTVLGLVLLGIAGSLAFVYTAMLVVALGQAVTNASHQAMVPDSIPEHARGRVYGFSSVMGVLAGLLASIVGPQFIDNQFVMATLAVPVFIVTSVIGVVIYRDRYLDARDVPPQPLLRTLVHGYRFNPKTAPDFTWVWLGRFLITFGIAFTGSFAIYFLTDELGVTKGELPSMVAVNSTLSLAGTLVGTIIGSVVTDKVRSRKSLVLVSALILAAGGVIVAFTPSVTVFFIGTALIYLAVGLFIPTDGVLVMSVLPGGDKEVSKFMSLVVIADQLPRSVGPMIAPAIIAAGGVTALGGYPVLYLAAGAFAIVGGVLVRRVRSVS
ncbi:MFS transporter [Streptomyces sp. SID8361]|uniref:MFS transporter n=1 Tax=Streptomyces sp. MnatMP-M27 TaxID=1839768 RepID=UPI00081F1D54|nr:MFS transporter [Streptomyces sp. MnatMP-M27]MYU16952.1 MFS transporter [Streptomyces sp. SID8361]SCG11523.1 Major Facilitator Superfamily protein [Streptomyces sp. MnatMP-M27]